MPALDFPSLPVAENGVRCIEARSSHDSTTGMRRGAAHIKVADRRSILCPTRSRPQEEQLFECQFALKDVSFRKPELPFNIERRQHLPVEDDVLDIRRVLRNRIHNRVAESLALLIPGSFF